MISIEEARKVLWSDAENISDERIQDLLNLLYSLCNYVYNNHQKGILKKDINKI